MDRIRVKTIKMIKIGELYPHPQNPRKDLGDLLELTESIRKNGIMQNLTVVKGHVRPKENEYSQNVWDTGGYTVVIGHRRCAAAKEAGLKEVPCVIANLTEEEQLCLMMEENMQRQDLTISEQAFGFQLMFDLGVSVQNIAEKTGFSETTIRSRLQIAELGKQTVDELLKNNEFQFSIEDFKLLGKIKDVEKRKELAQRNYFNGHYGFVNAVNEAAKKERWKENLEEWKPMLEAAGIKKAKDNVSHWTAGYETVKEFDLDKKPVTLRLKNSESKNLCWLVSYGTLYIKEKVPLKKEEVSQEEREEKEKRKQIETMARAAWKEMEEFVMQAFNEDRKPAAELKKDEPLRIVWNLLLDVRGEITFWNMINITEGENAYQLTHDKEMSWRERVNDKPVWMMMLAALADDSFYGETLEYTTRKYNREKAQKMIVCKKALNQLFGFEWQNPEFAAIADGTSDLYEVRK